MSTIDLSPTERRKRFRTERDFIAALTREEMIMAICDPKLFERLCWITEPGITREEAAGMLLDEMAQRGASGG